MTDKPDTAAADDDKKSKPQREPVVAAHQTSTSRGTLHYETEAAWQTLRDAREKPVAEMFHIIYRLQAVDDTEVDPAHRPITFVFNGGPGASSAYLHVGALGPRRVDFHDDGTMPPPPARLIDNEQTWLHMTDLVFVDPIGTGYSRTLEPPSSGSNDKAAGPSNDDAHRKSYWHVKKDLESLGELISHVLTTHKRWQSPIFIAGESYGGYRVARLARTLQEDYGVGLSGAFLISPAIEFSLLFGSDYDLLHWVDTFPSMAAAARHHDRARVEAETDAGFRKLAEEFARCEMLPALARGIAMPEAERILIYRRLADFLGLPTELVVRGEGRVPPRRFVRELLRDQRRVCGLYDAAMTTVDPFPDRDGFEGPDPTLAGIGRMFVGAIHTHLREALGIEEDERQYHLLSYEVFLNWTFQESGNSMRGMAGAMDDLRYGMALNPHLKVFITHGFYDLVTPYFSSSRLVDVMRLDRTLAGNLKLEHYPGGHMFYTWKDSREAFFKAAEAFYASANASG